MCSAHINRVLGCEIPPGICDLHGAPHFVSLWVQDVEDQPDLLTRTLRGLKAGQASLQEDVANLQDGQASLREDVATLLNCQANILRQVGHHISHALMGVQCFLQCHNVLQCFNVPWVFAMFKHASGLAVNTELLVNLSGWWDPRRVFNTGIPAQCMYVIPNSCHSQLAVLPPLNRCCLAGYRLLDMYILNLQEMWRS
jgi:hypothetical protein